MATSSTAKLRPNCYYIDRTVLVIIPVPPYVPGEQPWTMLVYDIGCLGDYRDTIVFRLLALSELRLAVLGCNGCVTIYHSVLVFFTTLELK